MDKPPVILTRRIALCIRLLLGAVLIAAAASKVAAFHPFVLSVSVLTGMPRALASPAAAIVIGLELAIGCLLILRLSKNVGAWGALVLFTAFAVVLSLAIVRGVEIPCNCFGVLGPVLPMRGQAFLDIVFAGGAYSLRRARIGHAGIEGNRFRIFLLVASAGFLWSIALVAWPSQAIHKSAGIYLPVNLHRDTSRVTRPSVLLLADFDDFGCQLCLDDFLAFCDSINTEKYRSAVSVRLLARRDSARGPAAQERFLEGWASGNGYRFPVSVDSAGVFEIAGVGKTSAIVLTRKGLLMDVVHFPIGKAKRSQILSAISG